MDLYYNPKAEYGTRIKAKNSMMDEMTAISRSLMQTQIDWSPEDKKLFVMCLTKIKWSESGNSNVVVLDKKEIIESLSLNIGADQRSKYVRNAFKRLMAGSMVHWTDPKDKERWTESYLITEVTSKRGVIEVTINKKYMPHLEDLAKGVSSYITMWSSDIYSFRSRFSFALFEELRLHYDSRKHNNYRRYTTRQLKELFGLDKEDYMRSKEMGGFNRSAFERRVLDVAVQEINRTKMMSILPILTGSLEEPTSKRGDTGVKLYRKIKENGRVKWYEFRYCVKTETEPPSDDEINFS